MTKKKSESALKGEIVEKLVEMLHQANGVKIERRVRLPSISNAKIKREIDLLLTSNVAGYPVRIVIECKNEVGLIGSSGIDQFVGKLQDIGVPIQHGIYVSATGYKRGVAERAQQLGIKTLILTGLTEDRLAAKVEEAIQSVVYAVLELNEITISNNSSAGSLENLQFVDIENKPVGVVQDLVWFHWIHGRIPARIGTHEGKIVPPIGWWQHVNGNLEKPLSVTVKYRVFGLIARLSGQVEHVFLSDAATQTVERFQINLNFERTSTELPLYTFISEADLLKFLNEQERVSLCGDYP